MRECALVGRMTMVKVKALVEKVLEAWDRWSICEDGRIDLLRHKFDGTTPPPQTRLKLEATTTRPGPGRTGRTTTRRGEEEGAAARWTRSERALPERPPTTSKKRKT